MCVCLAVAEHVCWTQFFLTTSLARVNDLFDSLMFSLPMPSSVHSRILSNGNKCSGNVLSRVTHRKHGIQKPLERVSKTTRMGNWPGLSGKLKDESRLSS